MYSSLILLTLPTKNKTKQNKTKLNYYELKTTNNKH